MERQDVHTPTAAEVRETAMNIVVDLCYAADDIVGTAYEKLDPYTPRAEFVVHDKPSNLWLRVEIKASRINSILTVLEDITDPESGEVVGSKGETYTDPSDVERILTMAGIVLEEYESLRPSDLYNLEWL